MYTFYTCIRPRTTPRARSPKNNDSHDRGRERERALEGVSQLKIGPRSPCGCDENREVLEAASLFPFYRGGFECGANYRRRFLDHVAMYVRVIRRGRLAICCPNVPRAVILAHRGEVVELQQSGLQLLAVACGCVTRRDVSAGTFSLPITTQRGFLNAWKHLTCLVVGLTYQRA